MKSQRPPCSLTATALTRAGAGTSASTGARMLALVLGAATLLAGCADVPMFQQRQARNVNHPKATAVLEREAAPARETASRRDPDAAPKDSSGLREGIRLYNDGDFDGAIRRLSARDLNNGPLATRLTAIKYTAFSYCVTGRTTQCRQSFDKALRLDPSFDLDPGEQGHPLWGPVFAKARQSVAPRQ
jgi:hypothetical protein